MEKILRTSLLVEGLLCEHNGFERRDDAEIRPLARTTGSTNRTGKVGNLEVVHRTSIIAPSRALFQAAASGGGN
jgi:hypothetical protein